MRSGFLGSLSGSKRRKNIDAIFIHLHAGSLVFLFGNYFGIEISRGYILLEAFFGLLPDIISYGLSRTVKLNKTPRS